ncbi:winged helix-turn-helix domain-containing protein [Humisphaera borealis]|uniref:Winged helix-turn-helix domain-containing protein n=1 Tax=Humisphaera borealis TaxID=2807512 RepID=A0A7M2WYN4_9BACT|nr:winged helix-turn-helix domain-containing protein [Humisphaera borealis]
MAAKPQSGRPPKLDAAKRSKIAGLLLLGPKHHGFDNDLWTLDRIAQVIQRHFSVSYHPSQVWRILLSIGWSCQKPQRRARERNDDAIEHWRRAVWPRIKKGAKTRQKRAVSR